MKVIVKNEPISMEELHQGDAFLDGNKVYIFLGSQSTKIKYDDWNYAAVRLTDGEVVLWSRFAMVKKVDATVTVPNS